MLKIPVSLKSCLKLDHSAELIQDGYFDSFSKIDRRINKNSIVFLDIDNQSFLSSLDVMVACIILQKGSNLSLLNRKEIGIILCDNPKSLFYKIHETCIDKNKYLDLINDSKISLSAVVSSNAYIGKNVIIGDNTIVEDGVIIYSNVKIGSNCIISAGSIIGSSGFISFKDGNLNLPVRSVGGVLIGNNVVIRSGTNINKATFAEFSIIEDNVIIDSLVHLGHDGFVGQNSLISAGVKIAGACKIGKNCWIGIGATISNGIIIGENAKVLIGSVVISNVKSGATYSGNFAIEHHRNLIRNLSSK